jgi:hypothetical protein
VTEREVVAAAVAAEGETVTEKEEIDHDPSARLSRCRMPLTTQGGGGVRAVMVVMVVMAVSHGVHQRGEGGDK